MHGAPKTKLDSFLLVTPTFNIPFRFCSLFAKSQLKGNHFESTLRNVHNLL